MKAGFFSLLAIAPAIALAAGCGARASVSPAVELRAGPSAAPPEPSHEGEFLLWGKTGDEEPKTYRVAADGSGQVLGEEKEILIATSKGELVFHLEPQKIVLDGCDIEGGAPPPDTPKGEGTLMVAELRTTGGDVAQTVIGAAYSGSVDVGEMEHSVILLGSVGSVLFLHQRTYIYACGAHGMTMAEFSMWDAEAGKPIGMLADVPDKPGLGKKAVEKLGPDGDDDPSAPPEEKTLPDLVQIMPVYGPRGALRIDAQLTRWDCYACSDGLWTSYSRSVMVETNWIPERFAPFVTPPVSVKVFLERHPNFELGGYSKKQ